MKKILRLWIMLSCFSVLLLSRAANCQTSVAIEPLDDSYVRNGSSYANSTFGNESALKVKNLPASNPSLMRRSYVKFDLHNSITGPITSAKVRLYAIAVGNYPVFCKKVSNDNWSEDSISWNNAPTVGASIGSVNINTVNQYYEWDVTAYVQAEFAGDKIVSLVFKDDGEHDPVIEFTSKEAFANRPQLVINGWRSQWYPATWEAPVDSVFGQNVFLQDFSYAGYRCGATAVPAVIGNVIDASASPFNADKTGVSDATDAIQRAIDSAQKISTGGTVYLPAGTYKISKRSGKDYCLNISKSNILLKGAGIGLTKLSNATNNMRITNSTSATIFKVSGGSTTGATVNLASDITKPTRNIPVTDVSQFKKGDTVLIRNDISDAWVIEHGMQGDSNLGWTGDGATLYGIKYIRIIDAVDTASDIITIDVPIRYTLRTRDEAQVLKLTKMIGEVGLSGFSIANLRNNKTYFSEDAYDSLNTGGYECHQSHAIKFSNVINGWITNVSTYEPNGNSGVHLLSNGIDVSSSKNITIENCYMGHAQYGGAGGNGYAYSLKANEVLLTRCTAVYTRHGFVFSNMSSSGNVIHQCLDSVTGYQVASPNKTQGSGSDHHMHFSHSNLVDNCTSYNSAFVAGYRTYGSKPHGLTATQSVFWNTESAGNIAEYGGDTVRYAVWTQQYQYGYAIGTSGTRDSVNTHPYSGNSAAKTAPIDLVEGIGTGTSLYPQSLYLNQLSKRLSVNGHANQSLMSAKNETTGVRELENGILEAYPNPSKGLFTLVFPKGKSGKVEVYRSSGNLIIKMVWQGHDTLCKLNLIGNAAGIYILRFITDDGELFIKKLIIE